MDNVSTGLLALGVDVETMLHLQEAFSRDLEHLVRASMQHILFMQGPPYAPIFLISRYIL